MQRKQNLKTNKIDGAKLKIGIVVSEYNSDVTFAMCDGAIEKLKNSGVKESNIKITNSPGGFEIPFICQRLLKTKKYDGLIAIGCVIRGDTDHYVHIATESTRGIMDVMLKFDIPISNAILTVNNLEQAKIRSKGDMNKGVEAAIALLKTLC